MSIKDYFEESARVKLEFIERNAEKMERAISTIRESLKAGNKILICGNGGSAADAQHFAAELVVRYKKNRKALPAIALTTDTSILTAGGNDFGFETIFERQVEALGNSGDVLIAISTSGNSENVIRAVKKARDMKIRTIGFLGNGGGKLADLVDIALIVPSDNTPRIQECHETIMHTICEEIESDY